MLQAIDLPAGLDAAELPGEVRLAITTAQRRIETFQDRWQRHRIEQFVAADYELVYQTLAWIRRSQPLIGNRFLEWGCGFAVVASLASWLDYDAIGIEAEAELLQQGRSTIADWFRDDQRPPELIAGNFLPAGSESLADDPTLPSVGHPIAPAYAALELELDDFAIVYSYPWPGEEIFHEDVFQRYAAPGALHLQFRGPNDVRLWRKTRERQI